MIAFFQCTVRLLNKMGRLITVTGEDLLFFVQGFCFFSERSAKEKQRAANKIYWLLAAGEFFSRLNSNPLPSRTVSKKKYQFPTLQKVNCSNKRIKSNKQNVLVTEEAQPWFAPTGENFDFDSFIWLKTPCFRLFFLQNQVSQALYIEEKTRQSF